MSGLSDHCHVASSIVEYVSDGTAEDSVLGQGPSALAVLFGWTCPVAHDHFRYLFWDCFAPPS